MSTVMPIQLIDIDETKIEFLNEVSRLQRRSCTLVLQKVTGEAAQFDVYSWNQFGQSLLISAGPRTENLCRLCQPCIGHFPFHKLNYSVTAGGPIRDAPSLKKLFVR